jgi:hypothetical protein
MYISDTYYIKSIYILPNGFINCDIEVWMVGMHQVLHANQDTQAKIEAYHGTIKWWLKHDTSLRQKPEE